MGREVVQGIMRRILGIHLDDDALWIDLVDFVYEYGYIDIV